MRRSLACVLAIVGMVTVTAAFSQQKPRIAVLKIKNKSDYGAERMARACEDWLVEGLAQSGKFRVIERQELESILQEQGLSLSGAVDDKTAVQAGKLLGCQLVVLGAITDFSTHRSGGGVGYYIGVDVSKTKAEGTLNVRLVNTTTAEIIYTGSERGEASFSKVFVAGMGGGVDWDESQARQIFEPAVGRAVAKIVSSVDSIKDSLGAAGALSGKIAKVSEGKIYISIGSTDGVKEGDTFNLFRLGEEITDPDTGKKLGQEKSRIGTFTVTKVVAEHLSLGVSDSQSAQVGDLLEK